MAAPVIQFKRGVLANLPGLRAGEPGFTTDSYDLYVGIDSTTSNNQFVGSGRYWSVNTATVGSGVKLVEGTDNGTSAITLKAPNSLSGDLTYTMPGTDGSNGDILTTDGSGNLSFSAPAASTFTLSADSGSDDTFSTGETLTFAGTANEVETTVSDNTITFGLPSTISANVTGDLTGDVTGDLTGNVTGNVTGNINATGVSTFQGDVHLGDSDTLHFGASDDLEILHNGSNSRIADRGTGNLQLVSNSNILLLHQDDASDPGATMAKFSSDGSNELYFNGNKKFETTNNGAVVTGILTATTFSGSGASLTNLPAANITGTLPISNGGTGATSASAARAALGVDAAGTDNSTDVTLAGNNYLSLSGQQITAGNIALTSHVSGVLPIANGGTGGGSASSARAALGVDAAGTDNSTDVTLAGASYLSLSGQQITASPINLGSQTTGTLPVGSLSASSITVSDGTNSSAVTLGNTVTFAATANETTVVESSGTVTIGLPNDVTVSNDLTVSGNLIVNGSTTQVNTTTTTVDDTLFDLGTVSGSAPTSDVNKDIGVLFNYYSGSAKKAAVYWDDSASRIVVSADVSESSSVLTNSTAAALEIGSLYVNDCAGNSQVINCSGSERTLENITLDGGSF